MWIKTFYFISNIKINNIESSKNILFKNEVKICNNKESIYVNKDKEGNKVNDDDRKRNK